MSGNDATRVVRRLWEFCNVLRDDGLSYPDYVEQLTYLLFLKMSDEKGLDVLPRKFAWSTFLDKDARTLHAHYQHVLSGLSKYEGIVGLIFRDARNKIRDPAKLRLLVVDLIGSMEWVSLSDDVKGDAYEGLLEKNARDTKSGAGQYFTPRALIDAIVRCVNPRSGEIVCDPACGTGGFLLAAHRYILAASPRLTSKQRKHLALRALRGVELVPEVARLAAMNLLLHGVGGETDDDLPIQCFDSLEAPPGGQVDVVLTNPPFGIKGTVSYSNRSGSGRGRDEDLVAHRPDFWVQTSNKQLNFVQHVVSLLKPGGRAAMVLPDNVLFEGGAAASVRRKLLELCDVHTILRLPAGLFYAQSVNANVLFFNRRVTKPPRVDRRVLCAYDLRSGNRYTKTRPLAPSDLEEFVGVFEERNSRSLNRLPANGGLPPRWYAVGLREILASEDSAFDITWSANRPASDDVGGIARIEELSQSISNDLMQALGHVARAGGGVTAKA